MLPRAADKIAGDGDALARIAALPRPLVFTNGVFDILHRGHVAYLEDARNLGAALVVAVNTDDSVRRLGKGDGRPHNPLADRMAVLAALASVDLVVPFAADTPRDLIVAARPDILVKGGDYTADNDGRRGRGDRRRRAVRGDRVRASALDHRADRAHPRAARRCVARRAHVA